VVVGSRTVRSRPIDASTIETEEAVAAEGSTGRNTDDGLRRLVTSDRLALWVFIAYLVIAVPVLLHIGSGRWFYGDDWTLISERSATDLDGLFKPNNRHWNTLGILAFRALYAVFGIRTYVPYMLLVILMHLGTVALIRVILRRIGIGGWIATISAASLVLLGPANENILWAVQITFVGSILFCLVQLLLADHDGPIDKRDWLALLAGLCALMTSSQAPPIIFATGLYLLYRRGWRPAAFHAVPLLAIYGVWYVAYDNSLASSAAVSGLAFPKMGIGDFVHWNLVAVRGLLDGLGHFSVVAIGLGVMLVVGFVTAWRTREKADFRRGAVLCGCLVLAAAISMALAAPGRFFLSPDYAATSRYFGIMAMMCLPAIAFAADALVRRWSLLWPVVIALFVLPIPWNSTSFSNELLFSHAFHRSTKAMVVAIANDPRSREVPPSTKPLELEGVPRMTIGWLLGAEDEGKVPTADVLLPAAASTLPVRIGVMQLPGDVPAGVQCREYDQPLVLNPEQGQQYGIPTQARVLGEPTGGVMVSAREDGAWAPGQPVGFVPLPNSQTLEVTLPDLHLVVSAPPGTQTFQFCT
jgi:hypothetical protein